MIDPRMQKLAKILVRYSCNLKKGEKILIEASGIPSEMITEIVKEVYSVGGMPFVEISDNKVKRELLNGATDEMLKAWADFDAYRMKEMDAAKMSTEAFEDLYFKVCNLDYGKMDKAMDALGALMEKTDKVRIVSPDTDLTFSIKGIGFQKCSGERNIPDGEIYTAPVKNSVNGVIHYNAPSIENGIEFKDVRLVFKDGKIIEATANDTAAANRIFDTDEGARYVGEFSFGVNPFISKAIGDILFDEKISGSIHFTPGCCYEDCDNGNRSAVHWDLVLVQTPEYGGGEIYFDGVLIRKDGRFVLPQLECLNPENLV